MDLVAGSDDDSRRLDKVIRIALPDLPLSAIFRLFRTGRVRVNGVKALASTRVREGDAIRVEAFSEGRTRETTTPQAAKAIEPLAMTSDLAFFNKPKGMLTHGLDSLDELVRPTLLSEKDASLSFSPGPLHRLDRNTSGIVAFPRSTLGARVFSDALRSRRIGKLYLAVLQGRLRGGAHWIDPLVRLRSERKTLASPMKDARKAETIVAPIALAGSYTLAVIRILTGVSHQIRAQASTHGFPLAGDKKYGGEPFPCGYVLHASALFIPDIGISGTPLRVNAPLDDRTTDVLEGFFGAEAVERAMGMTIGAMPEC